MYLVMGERCRLGALAFLEPYSEIGVFRHFFPDAVSQSGCVAESGYMHHGQQSGVGQIMVAHIQGIFRIQAVKIEFAETIGFLWQIFSAFLLLSLFHMGRIALLFFLA